MDFVLTGVVVVDSSCQDGIEGLGEVRIAGFWGKDRLKCCTTYSVDLIV